MTLPDRFEDVLGLVDDVGPQLADLAERIDTGAAQSAEAYRLLARAGFLELLVPRTAGGAGLGFEQYWRVLGALGRHNGAAALGLNMHHSVIAPICESANVPLPPMADAFRRWLFAQVVDERRMFASAASESGGWKLAQIRSTYTKEGGDFVVSGEKSNVSLAGVADFYAVTARPRGADGARQVSHFLVERDDPGVAFGCPEELTALYGTSTATMSLTEVPVPRSRLFLGLEGTSIARLAREPHWTVASYTGAYLGIAEAIHRCTIEHLSEKPGQRERDWIQQEVGLMSVKLASARALVHEAGRVVDEVRGSVHANELIHAAKYAVGDVGHELARSAVRMCGSAAIRRGQPLERLVREVQFIDVMPTKPVDCLAYVGKAGFGIDVLDERTLTW